MVVVAYGSLDNSDTVARTFIQNSEGLWLNGRKYVPETGWELEVEDSYCIGTNVKAIIVFNKAYNMGTLTPQKIQQVLRHELGHAIGLRHTFDADYGETEPGIISLMHPNCMSKYSSLTFTDYDMGELNKVYP